MKIQETHAKYTRKERFVLVYRDTAKCGLPLIVPLAFIRGLLSSALVVHNAFFFQDFVKKKV